MACSASAPENLHDVFDQLPIERLFGVGAKSLPAVHACGLKTFGDVAHASDAELWSAFGKHGKAMQALAAGLDERPVVAERHEKSISAEETFDRDIRGSPRCSTGISPRSATAPPLACARPT